MTLDTSGILAVVSIRDKDHHAVAAAVQEERGRMFIPTALLTEITFMIERGFPPRVEHDFLQDLQIGTFALDWHDQDIERIQQLVIRYHDLPLGFADATVVACAERHGGRVLTTDRRHFGIVARGERTLTLLPAHL
jgi:uncharacterized protein